MCSVAVSYTHLDVYKRQSLGVPYIVVVGGNDMKDVFAGSDIGIIGFFTGSHMIPCLLYTSRCV